jgi:tight adherence protein B
MNPTMLTVVIFLTVSAFIGILAFVFMDSKGNRATERLDSLVGKRRKESAADMLLKQSVVETDRKNLMDALMPDVFTLKTLFEQADCHIRPSTLFGLSLVMGLVGASISFLMVKSWLLAPLVGLSATTIPFLWLLNKRRTRLKAFATQLPDALELVARALRAGHAMAAGMHVVAEEMPSPICDEFGRVYEEQNLGIALEDAMRSMCDRVPNLDLRFFVTAVAIQRQTGGDLAEILDKIGYVIRERYKILGQVKALTAEGRMSGVILIALPFALLLVMLHIKPDYVQTLWTHPMGIKMSIGAMVLMLLGAIAIKKIVDIKV